MKIEYNVQSGINREPVPAADLALHGLDLYVTTTCDRRCTHCFLPDTWLNSGQRMDTDMVDAIVEWSAAPGSTIEEITVLGGEPSRHPQFPEIVRSIGAANLSARVVTNGSPAFRKAVTDNADLTELITRTSISIDAPNAERHDKIRGRGTFGWTLATAETLHDRGMPFDINCTLLRDNVDLAGEMIDFAEGLGASRLNIHWYTLAGRGRLHAADQVPSPGEWRDVLDVVAAKRVAAGITIDCELGYTLGLHGEDLSMCAVRDRSNLQIMPDGSAMICGMLPEFPELSGYVWHEGNLYQRNSPRDEIALVQNASACGGCPLRSSIGPTTVPLCIYNRLG